MAYPPQRAAMNRTLHSIYDGGAGDCVMVLVFLTLETLLEDVRDAGFFFSDRYLALET